MKRTKIFDNKEYEFDGSMILSESQIEERIKKYKEKGYLVKTYQFKERSNYPTITEFYIRK